MSVYGSFITESKGTITYMDCINYLYESWTDISLMLQKNEILYEENSTGLSVIFQKSDKPQDSLSIKEEDIKQTVIEKIKGAINRFVAYIKEKFKKFADFIKKKYMEINLIDKMVSKNKDIVTYDNLKKAKDKGWEGFSIKTPLVNKIANPSDSTLYIEYAKNERVQKVNNALEKIRDSRSVDDANRYYGYFKKEIDELKKFKKDNITSIETNNEINVIKAQSDYNLQSMLFGIAAAFGDVDASSVQAKEDSFKDLNKAIGNLFFILPKERLGPKGEYYFPTKEMFEHQKNFAENGERLSKEYAQAYKAPLSIIKSDKTMNLKNSKTYAKDNQTTGKILSLYYKAKFEYASVFLTAMTNGISSIMRLVRIQHFYAIKFYRTAYRAIKKYKIV